MAHTLTITIDDTIYETLKPFIEQQTIDTFISTIIEKNLPSKQKLHSCIKSYKGSLHHVDTSDIREEDDRAL